MFLTTQQSDNMAMENKKTCLPARKGSILAYSLIIIATMLAIASSLSVTAVIEKKSASGTEFSMQSLQTADSGVQLALKKLNAEFALPSGAGGTLLSIGQVFSGCDATGKISGIDAGPGGSSYELTFFDKTSPTPVKLECTDVISKIASVHSIGTYKNTVRAVDVSVAPPASPCSAATAVNSFCSFDGLTYGTVAALNGEIWLDRNLGAKQVATAVDDAFAYGHYYQWGREADGHELPSSTVITTLSTIDKPDHSNFIGNSAASPASAPDYQDWRSNNNNNRWAIGENDPCPTGFSVPTQADWAGFVTAEGVTVASDAFDSTLKLPAASNRSRSNGALSLTGLGKLGYYWMSSVNGTNGRAFRFDLNTTTVSANASYVRANGFPVRCIQD